MSTSDELHTLARRFGFIMRVELHLHRREKSIFLYPCDSEQKVSEMSAGFLLGRIIILLFQDVPIENIAIEIPGESQIVMTLPHPLSVLN